MSICRLFVVLSRFLPVLLIVSFGVSEEGWAQTDVPDWAESRTHAPPPDDAEPHERDRSRTEILDQRPFQNHPLSPGQSSSEGSGLFSPQPAPKAGPPPPDGPENQVPLPGSGLALLSAAGVGYAVRKLSQDDDAADAE